MVKKKKEMTKAQLIPRVRSRLLSANKKDKFARDAIRKINLEKVDKPRLKRLLAKPKSKLKVSSKL